MKAINPNPKLQFLIGSFVFVLVVNCMAADKEATNSINPSKPSERTMSTADRIEALAIDLAKQLNATLSSGQKKLRVGVLPLEDKVGQESAFNEALCELLTSELFNLG